jgi:hypothetical protein
MKCHNRNHTSRIIIEFTKIFDFHNYAHDIHSLFSEKLRTVKENVVHIINIIQLYKKFDYTNSRENRV